MSRRGWILFLSLAFIWGTPYLFIRIAVQYVEPSVLVFARVGLAALILLPIAAARGQLRGLRPHLPWIILFGIIEITGPFFALGYAEKRLSSSLTALLIAAVPICAALLAYGLHLDRAFTATRILGLLIGIAGVGVLVGFDVHGDSWWAVAAAAVAVVGYASAPMLLALKLKDAPGMAVIALSLLLNTIIFAPLAWIQRPAGPVPATAWWSLAFLGLFCTALAFIVFFQLFEEVGPARMTVITYLNPAVAVTLGVVVLAEPVTWGLLLGFPLVLLGSFLATRKAPAVELEDSPHG